MAISEAARADLYTGLAEVLGRERAETLMAYLPTFDPTDVATKADIAGLREEMSDLRSDMSDLRTDMSDLRSQMSDLRSQMSDLRTEITDLRSDMDRRLIDVNGRLDRLYHTLLAGMFVVLAAMIGLAVLIT